MPAQTILKRLERAEGAAKAQSKFSPHCICFPENEQPFFSSPIEQKLAANLKCPTHENRFKPRTFIYVSKWLRDKQPHLLQTRHGAQYRKAWFATFPPDLWPGEEVLVEGHLAVRLKDGTVLR